MEKEVYGICYEVESINILTCHKASFQTCGLRCSQTKRNVGI